MAKTSGERPFVNNGVLTIFWRSRAVMERCTFTGNRNGVDDMGGESSYTACVFADNTLDTGLKGFGRYALAVNAGANTVALQASATASGVQDDALRAALESLTLNFLTRTKT